MSSHKLYKMCVVHNSVSKLHKTLQLCGSYAVIIRKFVFRRPYYEFVCKDTRHVNVHICYTLMNIYSLHAIIVYRSWVVCYNNFSHAKLYFVKGKSMEMAYYHFNICNSFATHVRVYDTVCVCVCVCASYMLLDISVKHFHCYYEDIVM